MTAPDGIVRIPLNESSDPKSQINEYLDQYHGEGIQHIACFTDNIYDTVEAMRAAGVSFLNTPDTYFDVIDQRVPNHGEDVPRLARNKILIDADPETHQRKLLQIFTQNVNGFAGSNSSKPGAPILRTIVAPTTCEVHDQIWPVAMLRICCAAAHRASAHWPSVAFWIAWIVPDLSIEKGAPERVVASNWNMIVVPIGQAVAPPVMVTAALPSPGSIAPKNCWQAMAAAGEAVTNSADDAIGPPFDCHTQPPGDTHLNLGCGFEGMNC
jgi:hypothetical protein